MNSIVVEKTSAAHYDIIFCGLRKGVDIEKVGHQFGLLFGYSDAQVKKIFARNRITLKKNLNEKTANRFVHCLQLMGVVVEQAKVMVDVAPEHIRGERDFPPSRTLQLMTNYTLQALPIVPHISRDNIKNSVLPTADEKRAKVRELELKLQKIKMAKAGRMARKECVVGDEISDAVTSQTDIKFSAIRYQDHGEESIESSAMHQHVEPVKTNITDAYYWGKRAAVVIAIVTTLGAFCTWAYVF